MAEILVIVPAYNEGKAIAGVIAGISQCLPEADIVVIDGGSKDSTVDQARKHGASVIYMPHSFGIGGAVEVGYRLALEKDYDVVARVDGDGQHRPEELRELVSLVREGKADMAIGSRYRTFSGYRTPMSRLLVTKLFAGLVSAATRNRITDPTSGFRVLNRQAVRFSILECPYDYSEIEEIVLLHRAKFNVAEVPVSMNRAEGGKSSFTPMRVFFYMLTNLLALSVGLLRKSPPRGR